MRPSQACCGVTITPRGGKAPFWEVFTWVGRKKIAGFGETFEAAQAEMLVKECGVLMTEKPSCR